LIGIFCYLLSLNCRPEAGRPLAETIRADLN
jgi:hypothetical protein